MNKLPGKHVFRLFLAPPVFVADNKPGKIGQIGKRLELKIYVYDKFYNSKVVIKKFGTTVKITPNMTALLSTHDIFYGVYITVPGTQYTFYLHLRSKNDFTNYTVEACNVIGCNYFHVMVESTSKLNRTG